MICPCGQFIGTRVRDGVPVCYVCAKKIDKRLLDERQRKAQAECHETPALLARLASVLPVGLWLYV